MDALTIAIKNTYAESKETESGRKLKDDLLNRIQSIIHANHSRAEVVVVGSCANSFETRNSDLDLTVITSSYSSGILLALKKALDQQPSTHINTQYVGAATVPIVSWVYHSGSDTLSCDVSVNALNNVFNAVLLKAYSQLDDRVQPLVIALKKWAKAAAIIDARNNKLSSFTFTLMVIHYLQCGCSPRMLPSLQKLQSKFFDPLEAKKIAKYINDPIPDEKTSFSSTNTQSLGELFAGFFHHYASFSWYRNGISVREGALVRRPLKRGSNNTCLYVEDPYTSNCNTARSVFREWIWKGILAKICQANQMIKQRKAFSELLLY